MCIRQLSPKEEKVKADFAKCGLVEMCIETATLSTASELFLVTKPALYRIENTNSYLLFGDPVDYTTVIKQLQESSKDPEALKRMMGQAREKEERVIDGEAGEEGAEEAVVESEINEEDLKLIMTESKVSRDEAAKALREAGNDVIQALVNINKL